MPICFSIKPRYQHVLYLIFILTAICNSDSGYINKIPEVELTTLKEILSANNIIFSSDNIGKLVTITCGHGKVWVSAICLHDDITLLPQSVSKFKDLERIDIWGSDYKPTLPYGITYFKPVESFRLYDMTIDSTFDSILIHFNPEKLVLKNCVINKFPNHIYNISKLRYLDLSNDSINDISEDIGKLSNLSYLALSGNRLHSLPSTISNLDNLTHLLIDNNNLTIFPMVIIGFNGLKELGIANNIISELPQEICKLINIKPLKMHKDGYKSSSESFIYRLRVDGNKICNSTPDVTSYLNQYAGDDWKRYQKCE